MEEARKGVDDAHSTLGARIKELQKQAEDRASYRRDIKHYEEKIPTLQKGPAATPKDTARLEENQKKLEDVSGRKGRVGWLAAQGAAASFGHTMW